MFITFTDAYLKFFQETPLSVFLHVIQLIEDLSILENIHLQLIQFDHEI
jgi:hypothetical protein